MSKALQALRGMKDILPEQVGQWQHLQAIVTDTLAEYGYDEIRMPLMERTELFKRSVGEHTDIVEKEMYTLPERDGEGMTLRPEGTASCIRAALQNGLLHNQRQRLWYSGPMFRYERPQRGRYRQFHQIGAEAFGFAGPDVDFELLMICARLWDRLGLPGLSLEINSLGTPECRREYRDKLVAYLSEFSDQLDDDSKRRLQRNPLRVLDSKDPATRSVVADAPRLIDHLDEESSEHFEQLKQMLDSVGQAYRVNSSLVRGLDYYTHTVFEWLTDQLGAQNAVCAGGRYDGLVALIGGRSMPGVGFAMGVERLVELMDMAGSSAPAVHPHAYLVAVGDQAAQAAPALAERLRDEVSGLRLTMHCGGGSFKSQFKAADKSAAEVALVLGEDEVSDKRIGWKPLRGGDEQKQVAWDVLAGELTALLTRD